MAANQAIFDNYIKFHSALYNPLVFSYFPITRQCCKFQGKSENYINGLRDNDVVTYYGQDSESFSIVDNSPSNNLDAILSISRTIFVCVALTFGAIVFNNDIQEIIINPIETMLQKV